ncbi:MAG: NFACT family protein [Anaerolineae bacterium]
MYIDAFSVAALVDEFLDTLVGGRVQDSIAVDEDSIGLEIYANHRRQYLYLSANNQQPRVHIVPDKLRRGVPKPSQLGLLFRRYVEGGSVEHVQQPAWERILEIEVDGPEGRVTIIIEPMERRSNLLLVQNGMILDCMRRVGPDENRYRVSLPGKDYVPPPPQVGKHNPVRMTYEDLLGVMEPNDDPKRKTHQALTARILGMSPLLAREIVFRACGDSEQKLSAANADALYSALQTVIEPLGKRQWQPGIAETDGQVKAFSVYPIEHLPVGTASKRSARRWRAITARPKGKMPTTPGRISSALRWMKSKRG